MLCVIHSIYVIGCIGWAERWRRNNWCTTAGPVAHGDLCKKILVLLESYGTHHVPSHVGLSENEWVDELASQGRLRRSLWTANKLLLTVHKEREREEPGRGIHIVGVRESTPPPQPDDFVPWTPESIISMASSGVLVYTPDGSRPSPQHSQDFSDFEV